MKATQKLHEMGQSLWLDNITRGLLTSGTLRRYIREFSITGLTSNPTIFDHAIKNGHDYDDAIHANGGRAVGRVALLRAGAGGPAPGGRSVSDDPRPDERRGRVGVAGSLATAGPRHGRHARRGQGTSRPRSTAQSLHQDTGHERGPARHREAIFAGVPINVTLLFSRAQYVAAADAYRRGIERRIAAGLNPAVGSVASMFISRWDVAVRTKAPEAFATSSALRSLDRPTKRTVLWSIRPPGSASSTPVLAASVCSGPARGPKTRTPPTSCTSTRSPHPLP